MRPYLNRTKQKGGEQPADDKEEAGVGEKGKRRADETPTDPQVLSWPSLTCRNLAWLASLPGCICTLDPM